MMNSYFRFPRSLISVVWIAVLFGCTNKEQTHYTNKMNAINPKAPVTPLDILIDGKRLRLSSEYVSLVGPWDPEKQAFIGYLSFQFDADTYLPVTSKSRRDVWGHAKPRAAKVWGGKDELAARLSDDPKFSYLHIVRNPEKDKFGLEAYQTKEKEAPSEIFIGRLGDDRIYISKCHPEKIFPNPVCIDMTMYKNMQLEIAFHKKYLSSWRELHDNTLAKLSTFIVQEQK